MKNTTKRFTRKLAAMLAAVTAMTTFAAVSASADNGKIKLNPIECVQAYRQTYVPECVAMIVVTTRGEGIVRGVRSNSTAQYDVEACGDRVTVDLWSKKGEDLIFTAEAREDWTFVHWINAKTGEVYSAEAELTFGTGDYFELVAEFKPVEESKPGAENGKDSKTSKESKTPVLDQIDINEIIKFLPLDIF